MNIEQYEFFSAFTRSSLKWQVGEPLGDRSVIMFAIDLRSPVSSVELIKKTFFSRVLFFQKGYPVVN